PYSGSAPQSASAAVLASAGSRGRGARNPGDDYDRLRMRKIVAQTDVDTRVHARGWDAPQMCRPPARQHHCRPARTQIDDAHVTPENAFAQPRSERLGAGFLGGKPLGVGGGAAGPPFGFGALGGGEDTLEKTFTEALQGAFDAADVD